MRTPRPVRNPLLVMQGKQPLGAAMADVCILPLAAHLFEAAEGRCAGASIRQLTVYMSAARDAGLYYNDRVLVAACDKASDLWITAGYRCQDHAILDRVVLDSATLLALRDMLWMLYARLPAMERAVWTACMMQAAQRWDRFAAASPAFSPAAKGLRPNAV